MKLNDLSKKIKKAITPKEKSISGFIGRISDNAVIVSGKKNYVYVTLSNGVIIQARNRFTPPALGMAVLLRPIQNDPVHFEIYDIRPSYSKDVDFVLLQNHATNHDWTKPDETRTHLRQFLPLRVMPAAAGGIAVDINAGWYETAAGGTAKYLGITSLDISSYAPATGALWLLIQLNRSGVLVYSVSATKTVGSLLNSDIPHRTRGLIALAAIRLYPAQTSIRDTINNPDLIDLRFSVGTENWPLDQDPNRVLVTDASSAVTTDDKFTYDNLTQKLTLGQTDATETLPNNSLQQGGVDVDTTHQLETYGIGTDGKGRVSTLAGRRGRGTNAAPTSAQIDDRLLALHGDSVDTPTSKTVFVQPYDWELGSGSGTAGGGTLYEDLVTGSSAIWVRQPHGGLLYTFVHTGSPTNNDSWKLQQTVSLQKFYFTAVDDSTTPIAGGSGKAAFKITVQCSGNVNPLTPPGCEATEGHGRIAVIFK